MAVRAEGEGGRVTPKEILAKWDHAVACWRLSDRAAIDSEMPESEKRTLRHSSVMAGCAFIEAAGGYGSGVDGPAAIALGWA